jgi:hypothetical protein
MELKNETKKYQQARQLICTRLKCTQTDFDFYIRSENLSRYKFYKGIEQMGYVWTGETWVRMYRLPDWYRRLRGAL